MTKHTRASWLVYVLGALTTGAVVAAFLVVGPASGSQTAVTRTAKAARGVVQSTVSGSGNLAATSQLNLGFKTGGTVTHIYVSQGQHVTEGQLLATLDPQSAEVALEQSKAALQSAEANLAKEEETDGETSTGSGSADSSSTGSSSSSDASAGAAAVTPAYTASDDTLAGTSAGATHIAAADAETAPVTAAYTTIDAQPTTPGATSAPGATSPSTTTTATTPTATTPNATTPTATSTTPSTTPASRTKSKGTAGTAPTSTGTSEGSTGEGEDKASKEAETDSYTKKATNDASTSSTVSAATREANLASARAAVKSDKLTVQSGEEAVQDTKLYAPEDGTIVSLSGQVGEVVSGSGTTKASSSSTSGSGSSTGASTTTSGAADSSSSSSTSSSSSSSAFAVLSNLSSMKLVVALSESEIGNVKAGQPATITVEALSGAKLAAHVSEVALLSTSSSDAVSYDVTFQLDQMDSGLKVGMSATAEVVVKQAEGVNVPTSAISADTVTVERDGKQVRRRVTTGLAGNTSTIVLSGLKAGETVVLPTASTTGSSSTSLTSKLTEHTGAGAIGGATTGGGFAGAGAGGGAFFGGGR